MTVNELKKNQIATIIEINAKGILLQKLFDMGFIEGQEIKLIRFSPLNDPLEVKILSYKITLRRAEASVIKVRI